MPINLTWKHIANPYPTDLPLNDGIPYTDGMTKGNNDLATADNIQIQNALGGYDTYYMSNGKNAKGATVAGLDGKWAQAGQYTPTTTGMIPVGSGAWYMRRGSTDFTVQVVRPYAL
jgi:predicted phosphohydrolase